MERNATELDTGRPRPEDRGWRHWRKLPHEPPVRRAADLDDAGITEEIAFPIRSARLVFADVDVLQHDFPFLSEEALCACQPELAAAPPAARRAAARNEVRRWLIENAALISEAQARPNEVQTPPASLGDAVRAFRPSRYGRALVVPVTGPDGQMGLLDVKGAGVATGRVPLPALHASGVLQMGEAIQDTLRQWVIDAAFGHSGSGFSTVPLYGLLDPGFDVRTVDGRWVPAAIQVRRAHRRPPTGAELPLPGSAEELLKLESEMVLRSYGVTSTNNGTVVEVGEFGGRMGVRYGEYPPTPFDDLPAEVVALIESLTRVGPRTPHRRAFYEGINVQLTREVSLRPRRATVVDFGHFTFRRRFDLPVLNMVRERWLRWGGVLDADNPNYVQVDPLLAVPLDDWPGPLSWELAVDLRAGTITGEQLRDRILAFIDAMTERWPEPPGPAAGGGRR